MSLTKRKTRLRRFLCRLFEEFSLAEAEDKYSVERVPATIPVSVPYEVKGTTNDFVDIITRPSSIPYGAASQHTLSSTAARPSALSATRLSGGTTNTQSEASQQRLATSSSSSGSGSSSPAASHYPPLRSQNPAYNVERIKRPLSTDNSRFSYPSLNSAVPSPSPPPSENRRPLSPALSPVTYPLPKPREQQSSSISPAVIPQALTSSRPPRPPKIPNNLPPAKRPLPADPSLGKARTEGGLLLRDIVLDSELISTFVAIASPNTEGNIETCALLLGKLADKQVSYYSPSVYEIETDTSTEKQCVHSHKYACSQTDGQ
jgi:hypothetical protein